MFRLSAVILLVAAVCARADGPADNLPDKVRPIPPLGIKLTEADREELQKGSDELGRGIEDLRKKSRHGSICFLMWRFITTRSATP